MPTIVELLIQTLMPVAVEAAKAKIEAGTVKPSPAAVAITAVASGAMQSKTIWVALLIAIAGFFEQNQQLLTQYIGADKMGLVMMIVSAIMMILRSVTSDSLPAAGGLPMPANTGIPQQPSA